MGKGRPTRSEIRQNLVDILYFLKNGYGYDIYKVYREIFPSVTMRVIYYHLKKGVTIGEFKVDRVQKEEGDYSWGSTVEKIYYALGPDAKPVGSIRIKEALEKMGKLPETPHPEPPPLPDEQPPMVPKTEESEVVQEPI